MKHRKADRHEVTTDHYGGRYIAMINAFLAPVPGAQFGAS